ncbi:MAG: NAD(P)H-quinone oxidoreductase subunit K, chloroplastic [Candidatus Omnitrophica bacterium]|nr:NAD(P)H-quinone oxidoreductase subunit K, chloroplastic [Candidatus Omnitrophota bacterium]
MNDDLLRPQSPAPGLVNLFKVEDAFNLARANSLWPLTFGLACCAIEFMAGGAARYDLDRFGFGVARPSPRQADLMIVAGTISRKMVPCIKTLYDQMASPKYVIALGGCATAGGPFKYPGQYGILEGIDKIIPVNVYVPGCPPRPEALIAGILELKKLVIAGKTQGTLSPAVVNDSQDARPADYKNAISRADFRKPPAPPAAAPAPAAS